MAEMVCSNFSDVVVVYNGDNQFELGFVEEYEQIKAAVWCPGTGNVGYNALGKVLRGEVKPSEERRILLCTIWKPFHGGITVMDL